MLLGPGCCRRRVTVARAPSRMGPSRRGRDVDETPAMMTFRRPVASSAGKAGQRYALIVPVRRITGTSGESPRSSGKIWPLGPSRRSWPGSSGSRASWRYPRETQDRVLEVSGTLIADPIGQADPMVDQQHDAVLGGGHVHGPWLTGDDIAAFSVVKWMRIVGGQSTSSRRSPHWFGTVASAPPSSP
jgi:hypothetical protein